MVGGPQYRVGSHRQFALLARRLAAAGTACMRFDYRGMGDSTGDSRTFEHIEHDLRCAIETFVMGVPELEEVANALFAALQSSGAEDAAGLDNEPLLDLEAPEAETIYGREGWTYRY